MNRLMFVRFPSRVVLYLLAFFICWSLLLYAYYLQYVQGLQPCPLCILQRFAIIAMAVVFGLAALHNPGQLGAKIYAALQLILGGTGVGLAGRHVWLQSLPPDQVPACGASLEYMLEVLPLSDVIAKVLKGTGECAAQDGWVFLGLTIPGWTLLFFIFLMIYSVAVVWRKKSP